jgi:hypothetical protein
MNVTRFGRRSVAIGAAVLAALGLAAGLAYAKIPGPGNVFSACMLNNVGTIRLIDKSLPDSNLMSHCKAGLETEVSWNQKGDPGIPGPAGKDGAPGKDGARGADGTTGRDGAPGKDGAPGQDGASVTNTAEPAGANCPNGGSRFTVGAGVPTFACSGRDGTNGADGADGANGVDGHDGSDGVSVTSAPEPAGTHCANGGSRFTAANGVTYACNGAPGTGGVAGQDASSAAGTAGVTITPATGLTEIPGLSQTLTVPSGSFVFIATDGGAQTTSSATTGFSATDIALSVDGNIVSDGGYKRLVMANTPGFVGAFAYWSLTKALPLTPGSHTIKVIAGGVGGGGSNAIVSGDRNSVLQGELDVLLLKQ